MQIFGKFVPDQDAILKVHLYFLRFFQVGIYLIDIH